MFHSCWMQKKLETPATPRAQAGVNHPLLAEPFDACQLALTLTEAVAFALGRLPADFDHLFNRLLNWIGTLPQPLARTWLLLSEASEASGELTDGRRVLRSVPAALASSLEDSLHRQRVAGLTFLLARRHGFLTSRARMIASAAELHDLGKILIPQSLLRRAGGLSAEETRLVEAHTILGARLLRGLGGAVGQVTREIALAHHENWEGDGYPLGLAGEAIPIAARLVKIADQYDALRSWRPYKASFGHEAALAVLLEGDGRSQPTHFEPNLLRNLWRSAGEIRELYETTFGSMVPSGADGGEEPPGETRR